MDYSNGPPTSTGINLPPIRAMDFTTHQTATMSHASGHYALPPPHHQAVNRQLPPLPYHQYQAQAVPQNAEYVQAARSQYTMDRPTGYMAAGGRLPLPPGMDPQISIVPSRHLGKTKEVKRRTKTGCMTCRRRRIKCDEGRPTCRNCAKSKRDCAGYDPVFQSPGPASHHTPTADSPSSHADPASLHSRDYYDPSPVSPTFAGSASSSFPNTSSHHDAAEFAYHRSPDPLVPQLGRPYDMGSSRSSAHPRFVSRLMTDHNRVYVPKRTIEELCCISGSRAPHVPPLPPDSTPNLESIQQVYDIAFAPGLDKFLETGYLRWFVNQGFSHLVADRGLLAQFLLYLTIISNNFNPNQPENAATQSQEARITWALLNLVVKPAHEGNEEADKFSRRIKAVEALLTGEPLTIVRGSMADFIHSEDGAMDMDPAPTTNKDNSSALEKQVYRRSEEFWKCVEKFAEAPRPPPATVDDPNSPLNQARELLDGLENRDILYSMMLLCSSHGQDEHPGSRPVSRAGSAYGGNGNGNGHHQKEPALARRFLDSEYTDGRASTTVFATVAGMASRAFQRN